MHHSELSKTCFLLKKIMNTFFFSFVCVQGHTEDFEYNIDYELK